MMAILRMPVVLLLFALGHVADTVIVNTTYGQVQGLTKTYEGRDVIQFKGIPFAAPPVGDLRFQKPRPPKKWNSTLNATEFGPSCIQNLLGNDEWLLENTNTSEDCLHLNIYIPNQIDLHRPKAVMVWIHGGGFTAGQATLIDGSYLALQGKVIVVMLNYRLGLFGFLSTEDSNAPGNYGLWDQKLGLQWVHDNIEYFGGDKTRVCIFGESAGGYSVGLQSIIPSNKGLFQRVISESGAVKSPRSLADGSRKVAFRAGQILKCNSNNNTAVLVECLRRKSAKEILNIQYDATHGLDTTDTFLNRLGPVIDNDLITEDPDALLEDVNSEAFKFFKSLDVMAGTNNREGGLMYWMMMKYQKSKQFNISFGISKQALCDVVAPLVATDYYNSYTDISQAICNQYTVSDVTSAEQGRSTLDVYGDVMFVVPTTDTVLVHSQYADTVKSTSATFQYIFSHEPSFPWIQDRPPWLNGANHAGELPFVFGLESMYKPNVPRPVEEQMLSKQMMIYWSNFASTGNPNIGPTVDMDLEVWPEFTSFGRSYMNLTVNLQAGKALFKDRMDFWLETVPDLMEKHKRTSNSAYYLQLSTTFMVVYAIVFICTRLY